MDQQYSDEETHVCPVCDTARRAANTPRGLEGLEYVNQCTCDSLDEFLDEF